ncbi:MAG: LysR family transcriptional regulator [Pseudomonadales bacterium]
MKNLPMDVLRSFITVAELGGFTQAGELLGRSQPAISLQIKRLEEMTNTHLFSRNSQGLKLTQQGETLFKYASDILSINDEAFNTFLKPTLSGRVRFGIPSEFATTLLPKIVGRFAKAYPNVTLEVTCDLSKSLLSEERANQFDLILALHDNPSNKHRGQVKADELVWVSSPDQHAHEKEAVPLIVAQEGCIYRHRAIQSLRKVNQDYRVVYTIPDLAGIKAAIEEGLGVTVLAKSTVPDNLKIIKPSEKYPKLGTVGISLIYDHKDPNEAMKRLVEFVATSLT